MLELNPSLQLGKLREKFRERGRVEIRNFLRPEAVEHLREHLIERTDWTLVLNAGKNVYEIPSETFEALTPEQHVEMDRRVFAAAERGFQYRYESIRVPDEDQDRKTRGTSLDNFVRFMASKKVLSILGEVMGSHDLTFADGQATAFGSGHFLNRHDDDVDGKHRRAAYVFGLQPTWNVDWGGLLMFHGKDGNVEEAFTPAMGALRLFRVPTPHSVSYVTPFATQRRLSITGWLRTKGPQR